MSVINGQLANASTFNSAFVSKTADSTTSGTLTQDKESVLKEIATPTTPSSGYGKIYFKADGKLYQLNDAGIETQVGSGAGGGGINYISNGSAEDNNTTGWGTYADAAGTSPVDGSGGTANVTISTSASSPLIGTYSFLMVKDAVNRQGQGWEYDFTIDSAYKAKVLQIDFEYLVSSGTFVAGTSSADSDVTVWIYDVTNGLVIQPSAYKLLSNSSTLSTKHSATFQSAANSTSYRLIFHVGSTSASAYTLKVDGISVAPEQYVYGTPVTDWQAYTPTLTGFGTATSVNFQWRRVGDNVEVRGKFTSGTSTGVEARASLPSVTSADTGKIASIQLVGMGANSAASANSRTVLIEPSVGYFTFGITTSNPLTKANGSGVAISGETISFFGLVPVQGWSSSVQTSDATDTRILAAAANTLSSTTLPANAALLFNTTTIDTHGAITTGAGYKYTVPVSGNYRISSTVPPITAGSNSLYVAKNGSFTFTAQNLITFVSTSHGGGGSIVLSLVSGDTIQFSFSSAATASNTNANFAIERLSGPSAIAATETVAYSGSRTAGNYSINNTTVTVVPNLTAVDTHGSMNTSTGIYTVPVSGIYEAIARSTYFCTVTGGYGAITLNMGAAGISSWLAQDSTNSNYRTITVSNLRRLNAGDQISFQMFNPNAATVVADTAGASTIQIKRIG
jgi:hypothetical protein